MSLGCEVAKRTRSSGETDATRRISSGKPTSPGAVGVDVLPQQRHFAVAVFEETPHLGDDGLRVAAPLTAPGVGNHAVGAEVVAPAHDRHEGAHAVAVEAHGGDLGVGLLGRKQHVDALAARLGAAHQARQVAVGVRPGHDIDARRSLRPAFRAGARPCSR